MQVDTGSLVGVVPQNIYEKYKKAWAKLKNTRLRLTCLLGRLSVQGELNLQVTYQGKMVD